MHLETNTSEAKARRHKRTALRHVTLGVIAVALSCFGCAKQGVAAPDDAAWLETKATQIVNSETGRPVVLRAVGLGNWLVQEGYMLNPEGCPDCPDTQWQMKRQYLEEGLSMAEVEDFYQRWRDRFITKDDIDDIASLGFNSVRLPMHYELFLTPEQRAARNAVILDPDAGDEGYRAALGGWLARAELFVDESTEGFQIIDRVLEWCAANELYVILDMHAAPGSQGSDLKISDGLFANHLWHYPVYQNTLNRLWLAISTRYRDEPRIAMYEFMNEPNNVPGGGEAIHRLTQRLLTSVRENGDQHIVVLHGNDWGNVYDQMEPSTFTPNHGLVYSSHRYWISPNDDWVPQSNPNQINRMVDLLNFRDTHQVPVWVGETGENTNSWLLQNVNKLNEAGIGWCHWTYKRHERKENAALLRIDGPYPTDGVGAMDAVLHHIQFEHLIPNDNTRAAITGRMPEPASGQAPIGQIVVLLGPNGRYVSVNAEGVLNCTAEEISERERFFIEDAGAGMIALRSSKGLYVSSENGQGPMTCTRTAVGDWERFEWYAVAGGRIALKGHTGRFVSSQNGTEPMVCDRELPDTWESFQFTIVTATQTETVQNE